MTDGYGKPLAIGARVKWPWNPDRDIDDEDYWRDADLLTGTVRALDEDNHRVRVDDGNATDHNLLTNGYTHSSWVYAVDTEFLCNDSA